MLYNPKNRNSLRIVMGLCALAISTGLDLSTARAQDTFEESSATTGSATTGSALASAAANVSAPEQEVTPLRPVDVHPGAKPSPSAGNPAKPYFIEFRARSAYSYGHTFLVHGRVGQKITAKDVVGLHPISESPVPWMIGHIIPVISETGASDGDYEDVYIIARYRILLSEAEYKPILAYLRQRQHNSPIWHAVLYNCNAFVGDVARHIGLKAPINTLAMPKDFINELKSMNNGRSVLSGPMTREAAAAPEAQQASAPAPSAPAPKANGSRPRTASTNARSQHAAVSAQAAGAPGRGQVGSSYAGVQ